MSNNQSTSRDESAPHAEHVGVVLATIGDTTWRMFVPSVGLTLLGVWADTRFIGMTGESVTKPWLMIAGIIIGCLGSFLLVKQQLAGIKKQKESAR